MNITEFITQYCGPDSTIQACLQGIYNLLVALAVVVAFFVFLFGAFENLLSTIPDVKMQGKNRMKNAMIGLAIIFIFGVILYWINPYIFSARLIMYKIIELGVQQIIIEGTQAVNNLLKTGQARNLNLNSFTNYARCKEFFDAIDELVNAGVGVSIFPLTQYKIKPPAVESEVSLSQKEIKILLKSLLITESGGHRCNPTNGGRGEYSFAVFGIEWGREGTGTRSPNTTTRYAAYQKLVEEAKNVYYQLPKSIKDKINLSLNDFNTKQIGVGGKLDNPYLITAIAIKRLHSYKRRLEEAGFPQYSDNLISILLYYKTGVPRGQHSDVANIIKTIKDEAGIT